MHGILSPALFVLSGPKFVASGLVPPLEDLMWLALDSTSHPTGKVLKKTLSDRLLFMFRNISRLSSASLRLYLAYGMTWSLQDPWA